MKKPTHFVYILLCENGSYYTGYTTNLTRRYQEHQQGTANANLLVALSHLALLKAGNLKVKV